MMHTEDGSGIITHCKQEDNIERLISKQDKCDELIRQLTSETLTKTTSNSDKLDVISDKMDDLKRVFDALNVCVNTISLTQAAGPTKAEFDRIKEDMVRHRTWFQLLGAAVGILATLLVGLTVAVVSHLI